MVEISTSLLSVKKEESVKTIHNLDEAHTDYFHIDVMDGKFVEADTSIMIKEYAEYIKQISNIPLDVHLMVEDVESYVKSYLALEPNIITFHYEALKDNAKIMEMIKYIKENNCKVGISICPDTEIEKIYEFLPYIHMVLVMSVIPGKGGQKLIPETIEKTKKLKKYLVENNIDVDIEIDGGINKDNIQKVKDAGVDIAVVGTYLVKQINYKDTIKALKKE